MKYKFIITLLSALQVIGCQSQQKNATTADVATFEKLLSENTNPQLIDVRTPEEFADSKIQNAVNINWNDAEFLKNIAYLDKSKPVFVYCLSGGRSKAAATKLAENGFVKVYDLKGGILKWNAAHQPKVNQSESEKNIGISPQEYTAILKNSPKTIVNIYAEWCAPCKKMAPYLLKMQSELKGKINLVRYDADKNKTILKKLNVDELPVILIYEGETLVWRHSGFLSENELRKQIK